MSRYTEILKQYWGYDSFRPLQDKIIESVGEGKDTLGLMPTGGGKSITFQVPALAKEGLCLVVTPLIALMKDQVENLRTKGVKAAAIYSGMTAKEISIIYDNCTFGGYKFLYLSPERVGTKSFLERLKNLQISMIAVDESHCISQWGYDFRPSYLKISELRAHLPGVPVLAVTATATPSVAQDIQRKLHFSEENIFQKSFERNNLIYVVKYIEDKEHYTLRMLNKLAGSAIIYVRNRKRTKELSEFLSSQGISSSFYHAGLPSVDKDARQKSWTAGHIRVMVATNAFGMGIDKPDVRLVVHHDLPDSIEAYFQEAGRAGRDELKAYAVLLFSKIDEKKVAKRIKDNFPEKAFVKQIYDCVYDYMKVAIGVGQDTSHTFDLAGFCHKYKLPILSTHSAIKILERAGYLIFAEDRTNASRLIYYDRYALMDNLNDDILERVVKASLRTYTGLFTEYAYINEGVIGRLAKANREQVYESLKVISDAKLGHYIPQNNYPIITLLQNRYETNRVHLSKEVYEDLQDRYIERCRAMLDYATTRAKCRSKTLLEYFGESAKACGYCDICLENAKRTSSDDDYGTLCREIQSVVGHAPVTLNAIVDALDYDHESIISVVRMMVEEGMIKYNEHMLLEKKK